MRGTITLLLLDRCQELLLLHYRLNISRLNNRREYKLLLENRLLINLGCEELLRCKELLLLHESVATADKGPLSQHPIADTDTNTIATAKIVDLYVDTAATANASSTKGTAGDDNAAFGITDHCDQDHHTDRNQGHQGSHRFLLTGPPFCPWERAWRTHRK